MYTCGPTVYGPAHIGNFRAFLLGDVVHRYLEWSGYEVTWMMNITDVDDRIIRDLPGEGRDARRVDRAAYCPFPGRLDRLRIGPPDVLARATRAHPRDGHLVATLLNKGHAYRTEDGSIFFRISSWPAYGMLARLDPDQARSTDRVAADDYGKDDVRDFALWKGTSPASRRGRRRLARAGRAGTSSARR